MALPTGQISMSQVNTELKRTSTASLNLNDAEVRHMARKTSGAISMNDLRGRSFSWLTATRSGGRALHVLGNSGISKLTKTTAGVRTNGIIDPNGNYWVVDGTAIRRFNYAGTQQAAWTVAGSGTIYDLAINHTHVFVARGTQLHKYTYAGALSWTVNHPNSDNVVCVCANKAGQIVIGSDRSRYSEITSAGAFVYTSTQLLHRVSSTFITPILKCIAVGNNYYLGGYGRITKHAFGSVSAIWQGGALKNLARNCTDIDVVNGYCYAAVIGSSAGFYEILDSTTGGGNSPQTVGPYVYTACYDPDYPAWVTTDSNAGTPPEDIVRKWTGWNRTGTNLWTFQTDGEGIINSVDVFPGRYLRHNP